MDSKKWALAVSFSLTVCIGTQAQTADDARIGALVRKLGSFSFVQREQARKELEAVGIPALESLRHAKKTADAETNRRIDDLIRLFEDQLRTQQILAPKEVHLQLKNVSVPQAIAELANLSGYPIEIQGNPLADQKITIDTGKTSFWQALDQLTEQAGLMERINVTPQPADLPMPAIGKRIIRFPVMPNTQAPVGPIVLVHRSSGKSLVSYAGAVKTELRISRVAGDSKELDLLFVISTEPRFVSNTLAGRPILDKLLDSQSQKLAEDLDPAAGKSAPMWIGTEAQQYRRFTGTRVKEGRQVAKQFKEIAGKLTLQVDLRNETLARIDKIMEAAGKSVEIVSGGTLKVQGVKKLGDGEVEVQVVLANVSANPFGGNVIINGGGAVIIRGNINGRIIIGPNGVQMNGSGGQGDLPDLVDARGQKYKVARVSDNSFSINNGNSSRTATIVYQANPGQAEPRELVLFGTRTHTIMVPFRFENLPLP